MQSNKLLEQIETEALKAMGVQTLDWVHCDAYNKNQLVVFKIPIVLRRVLSRPELLKVIATTKEKGSYLIDRIMQSVTFAGLTKGTGAKPVTYDGVPMPITNLGCLFCIRTSYMGHVAEDGRNQGPGEVYHTFLQELDPKLHAYRHTLKMLPTSPPPDYPNLNGR